MQNLFLLPTTNPTRIHYYDSDSPLGLSKEPLNWKEGRHLYITSNEDIKKGDWCLIDGTIVLKKNQNPTPLVNTNIKKIILTTDQDLIKDGVQAVPEDFLVWFVKHFDIEFIEYENNYNRGNGKTYYKPIIPNKRLKTEIDWSGFPKSTQEKVGYVQTDKEAREYAQLSYYGDEVDAFVNGANWKEKSIPSIIETYLETAFISKDLGYENPKTWFEKFKQKK
jgi:hypothetical protein